MRTPRLPVVDGTDASADLNGLVRFAERRNLVSARVPSHFKRSTTSQFWYQAKSNALEDCGLCQCLKHGKNLHILTRLCARVHFVGPFKVIYICVDMILVSVGGCTYPCRVQQHYNLCGECK